MNYSEIKSLFILGQRVILFDGNSGKQLYDSRNSKKDADKKYLNWGVCNIWSGTKQRVRNPAYPLTEIYESVICLYLYNPGGTIKS